MLGLDTVLAPAPHLGRQRARHVLRQPEDLADVADRALRPKPHHRGADSRSVAPIGLVDPLDHLLAAAGFEVDVDVRRLLALHGDEALEQQVVTLRINAGDPQHEADGGVGGRAPPLAQDALPSRELDDAVHGQEVGRVLHRADQLQLVAQLCDHGLGHAVGIDPLGGFPG